MSRSIWAILGVKAGSDRDTIRRAYAKRLRVTNPEDDPDGFMALRQAYETALARARMPVAAAGADIEAGDDEPGTIEAPLANRAAPASPELSWEAQAAASEAAAFEASRAALLDALQGPVPADDAGLRGYLAAMLASPKLEELGTRDEAETWLAHVIAAHLPRSDALIEPAMKAFGWSEDPALRSQPQAVEPILRRLREWRFVSSAQRPHAPLHLGWLALTMPPKANWRMRLSALLTGTPNEVRRIQFAASTELPGIRDWFNAAAEVWWDGYFAKPRATLALLLLVPLFAALGLVLAGDADEDLAAIPLLLLAVASPAIAIRWLIPARLRWAEAPWERKVWHMDGWMAAMPALVLLGALLPDHAGSTIAITIAAILTVAWTFVANPPSAIPTGDALWAFLRRAWPVGVLLVAASAALSSHQVIALGVIATALMTCWQLGETRLAAALVDLLPRWPLPILVAVTIALAMLPFAAQGLLPPGHIVYLVALAVVAGWLLLPLAGQLAPVNHSGLLLVLGWGVLVLAFLIALGWGADPGRTGAPSGEPPLVEAEPAPNRTLIATPPKPITPFDAWIDPKGYAPDAFKRDGVYSIAFRLDVRTDGGVAACTVTSSTGDTGIDDTTCAMLSERVRFSPAIDRDGKPMAASFAGAFSWTVSRQADAARTPPPKTAPALALAPAAAFHPPARCPEDDRRAAVPQGTAIPFKPCGTGEWIFADDYPASARRAGMEGVAGVELAIDSLGFVDGCTIAQSSGWPVLDDATCQLLRTRARFLPALDSSGNAMPATYFTRIRWQLKS